MPQTRPMSQRQINELKENAIHHKKSAQVIHQRKQVNSTMCFLATSNLQGIGEKAKNE